MELDVDGFFFTADKVKHSIAYLRDTVIDLQSKVYELEFGNSKLVYVDGSRKFQIDYAEGGKLRNDESLGTKVQYHFINFYIVVFRYESIY